MGADDLKTMFKAAKAQRGGGGSLVSKKLFDRKSDQGAILGMLGANN